MDIPTLLDEAKKAQRFETDMALAKALKISRSAVSAWRNGQKAPDTLQCAALAGYTGRPLAQVIGIAGEARAISREEKAVWRKLAATASMMMLVCALSLDAKAEAMVSNAAISSTSDLYIMRIAGRAGAWALRRLAQILQRLETIMRKEDSHASTVLA